MKKKTKKYEYKIFNTSSKSDINSAIAFEESNKWQICGDPSVAYHGGVTDAAYIYFPMKRIMKKPRSKIK